VAAIVIAIRVVDRNSIDGKIIGLDAEGLHGGVLDRQTRDRRVVQRVGVEELGLGLATIGAFPVPPAGTVRVDDGAVGSLDGDVGSGNLDERAAPLLVAESSGSLEDDLAPASEIYPISKIPQWLKGAVCH
jgi:hypothetical protein